MEYKFRDPDAEMIHRGLMTLLGAIRALDDRVSAVQATLDAPVKPSPVPEMIRLALAELEKANGKLDHAADGLDRIEKRVTLLSGA